MMGCVLTDGAWPTVVLGGAPKTGTTSIYNLLGHHPDVFTPACKEPYHFAFDGRPRFVGPGADRWQAEVVVEADRYRALFADGIAHRQRVDGSTLYLQMPGAATRIARTIPDVLLVFALRHPVDRAYSAWAHMRRDGHEPLAGFREALEAEDERLTRGWSPSFWYATLSRYAEALNRYLALFRSEQIHLVVQDELDDDPLAVLRRLERFLDLPPLDGYPIDVRHNVSGTPRSALLHRVLTRRSRTRQRLKRLLPTAVHHAVVRLRSANLDRPPPLDPATRSEVGARFADDVRAVDELTGLDLTRRWLDGG